LANHKQSLQNDFHGKFVYRNCHIDLFSRRKEEWLNHYKGIKKRMKTGNEIDDLFANKK
jgi:hypothetical protein